MVMLNIDENKDIYTQVFSLRNITKQNGAVIINCSIKIYCTMSPLQWQDLISSKALNKIVKKHVPIDFFLHIDF